MPSSCHRGHTWAAYASYVHHTYLLDEREEGLGGGDDAEEVHLHAEAEVLQREPVDQPGARHAFCGWVVGWVDGIALN